MNKLFLILLVCILSGCVSKFNKFNNFASFYTLEELSCDSISRLSSSGGSKILFTFTNTRDEIVDLNWINNKGEEISYGSIGIDETRGQITYITHPWVIRNKQGDCLTVFNSTANPKLVIK